MQTRHDYYWTERKIAKRLELIEPLVYRRRYPLPAFRFKALREADPSPPICSSIDISEWEQLEPNRYWGNWRQDFVLRTRFSVPREWPGDAPIALHLPLGEAGDFFCHPEALTYLDGIPIAAADRHHQELVLPDWACEGADHDLVLQGWTGHGSIPFDPELKSQLYMKQCEIVQVDRPVRDFLDLCKLALETLSNLASDAGARDHILSALDRAFRVLETRDPLGTSVFYDSAPAALATLKQGLAAAGPSLDGSIVAVGHAHIDVAWLWRTEQTRKKCARTFSSVLSLMEQYPSFRFSQSQPQLYKYLEEDHPKLFAKVKERVAEGRWEVMGGAWVEPDCNLSGSESLVRQFLLGRRYFQEKFGDVDTPVLWLPDTFGYAASMPQIIRQAGLDYFVTSKISWNQYNEMPWQLFRWRGLDGTEVLTHFLSTPHEVDYLPHTTTYNGMANPTEMIETWRNFKQKDAHDEVLVAYGWGDGGGGPTREQITSLELMADLPATPKARMGSVREYMERAERQTMDTGAGGGLPVWSGEMYLELHRGTLTSQATCKRDNRKCEFLLHDAEFLAAFAATLTPFAYPHAEFNQAWELMCLNQFHDILPGSSIGEVYEDTAREHAEVARIAKAHRESALNALRMQAHVNAVLLFVNPTTFSGTRTAFIEGAVPGPLKDLRSGKPVRQQSVDGGLLVEVPGAPSHAIISLGKDGSAAAAADGSEVTAYQEGEDFILENDLMRVIIDANGEVRSAYDKQADREVLQAGATGNRLIAQEDRPMAWDAWDIEIYVEDRTEVIRTPATIEVKEHGPIRAAIAVRRQWRDSEIVQEIQLRSGSKRIDFVTRVDWRQTHMLLKVEFPVDVFATTARFDIQFGSVERPTHQNTSWDIARFESAAQKWADLSEAGYGVALMNDCKYGYSVQDSTLRLSLLKGPTYPDPNADQGLHEMTWSLFPHLGDWRNGVDEEAMDLNNPCFCAPVDASAGGSSAESAELRFVSFGANTSAQIEWIKASEDGAGVILRTYESTGGRAKAPLSLFGRFEEASQVDLLERPTATAQSYSEDQPICYRPFEIASFKLTQRPI